MSNTSNRRYFRAMDLMIAAMVHVNQQNFAKAGAFMLKASQDPEFEDMVEQLSEDQQQAQDMQGQQQDPAVQQMSALASIVEGMSDGVNDNTMEDLLEDLDYEPSLEVDEPEDVDLGTGTDGGDVDVDTDDDTGPEVATTAKSQTMAVAKTRLNRAQANLRRLLAQKAGK